MRDSDQAKLRRALSSLLDRLEGPAHAEAEATGGDNSIIVIFLGQSDSANGGIQSPGARPGDAQSHVIESRAPVNRASHESAFTFDQRGMQAPHPGLEKFPIAETESTPAPKTCFMEPGRACVNSGACEMRGY
ncbi:MAG TPA: hypothetical protein VNI02_21775 [Blastocatellia bacterium]|jgi:hypothetical protein|nr:hypothetical protein [Blastocatellia bacterium]